MDYIFKGNLTAMKWDHCSESFSNVKVKLYNINERQNLNDLLAEGEKKILVIDNADEIQRKTKFLIGESETDFQGNFTIHLSDKIYHEQAFEIAIDCRSVTGSENLVINPVEFVVATMLPCWDKVSGRKEYGWDYTLPFGFWRYILSLFDCWVIYGRVISPGNPDIPMAGVEVKARDADWLSEIELGSAVTDHLGYFKIRYTGTNFRKSSVSGDKDGKPQYSFVYGGPDVCFTIKSSNGIILMDETKLDGRKPERSNIGNSFCITLPIAKRKKEEIMDCKWTGIGNTFSIPVGQVMNDFDACGYAGIMRYAISGKVRFTGQKVNRVGPHAVEYRFLIGKNAGRNDTPALPASKFTLVVGKDPGLFVETRIGQMWSYAPAFRIVNIYAKQIDLDEDGWLDISRSIERTFRSDPALNVQELSEPNRWTWVDHDGMMAMNTGTLTMVHHGYMTELKAGDDILPKNRIPVERIAVRFEIREVIDKAQNKYNYLSDHGKTLNSLVINNNHSVKLLGISNQVSGESDTTLTGQINVTYTAYHPHLRDVSINIRQKSEIDWHGLSDVTVPLTCNNNPAITICHNRHGISIPASLLKSSGTYVVMMYITMRLHTGDEPISTEWVDISFTYHKQSLIDQKELLSSEKTVVIL